MKNFIKDILILICLAIFVTSLFQGLTKKNNTSLDSSIAQFEENVSNGVIIENPNYVETNEGIDTSSNIFGKFATFCSNAVIFIVNGIIKIILFIVQKIV